MSQPSLDLDFDQADDTWTVSELTEAIARVVARGFPDEVWVRGEIDGLKRAPTGHLYFDLVEATERERAVLRVVLFSKPRQMVERYLRRHGMRLEDGMRIRLVGHVELYAPRGQVNLRMTGIDLNYTLGQLAADRDALVARLRQEGILERNRSLPLPLVPLRIGVVASRGSAGYADFVHQLSASGIGFDLRVADTRVQGPEAPSSIAAAVHALSRDAVDVIVVMRGGGGRSDLAAFDHEAVARAIAIATVPVVTGIGHETDRSVADLVAHTACKTPTACAALLVDRVGEFCARLDAAWERIARAGRHHSARQTDRLDALAGRVGRAARVALLHAEQRVAADSRLARHQATATLERAGERLSRAAGRVEGGARVHLRTSGVHLADVERRLLRRAPEVVRDAERALALAAARLDALDPARALQRGWSITRREDGSVVRDASTLTAGETLITMFAAGRATSTVTGIEEQP